MKTETLERIKQLWKESTAVTIVAAGKNGLPWIQQVWKMKIDENGRIEIYELLESSQIQKNLVYSIWFQKKVLLHLVLKDGRDFVIVTKPYHALIAGAEFENKYEECLKEFGDEADLSTVWKLEVEKIIEESYPAAREREKREHPYLMHMDHLINHKKEA